MKYPKCMTHFKKSQKMPLKRQDIANAEHREKGTLVHCWWNGNLV